MPGKPFGVIEGFYGDPWTTEERLECIDVLAANGGDTYVWAPKSEPRHRDRWEEPFTPAEIDGFALLISRSPAVNVSVALTPGPDATVEDVAAKMRPVTDAGCRTVTLCFDDLPVLRAGLRHRDLANGIRDVLGTDVWVVPTHYTGTETSPYLAELTDGLHPDVAVMWTGRTVVTDGITAAETAARAAATGGRAPLLWDNVPVNDAMMSALLHLGPYSGRERGVIDACGGILLNPMVSMRASLPMIESACAWWHGRDHVAAWESALDRLSLRALAAATAYPGDPHWPGDRPGRGWFEDVAAMAATGDPDIDPWVDAARAGASVCLAALDVLDAVAAGKEPSSVTRTALPVLGLDAWLRRPARTLGSGPRTRPLFGQDGAGRFVVKSGTVVMHESLPESHVRAAMEALAVRDMQ
jgi:hypothetical protein